METPKEYHYTYYSYEECGRGYIGSRTCKCLPEEDIRYFGSFYDKTFKPTQKIILKDDYTTRAEAIADEIILHDFYDVENNPHFANKAKQTSAGFCYFPTKEQSFSGVSREQRSENGKRNSAKNKENKVGIFALTTEQLVENAKKGGSIGVKIVNAQRWKCRITGYVSTAAGIVSHQKGKGIDTSKSNRSRIL